MRALASICALLAAASPIAAFSQSEPYAPAETEAFRVLIEQEAEELAVKNPKDSDIINLVKSVMMVRLAHSLDLSVEETQNLGHRVGQSIDQIFHLKWLRAEKRYTLREAIESNDMEKVKEELDKLLKLEVSITRVLEKMVEDSRHELSLEQSAEFYLFVEDFESEISGIMTKALDISEEKKARAAETASNSAHN